MLLVIHGSPKIISSIYLLPAADLDLPVFVPCSLLMQPLPIALCVPLCVPEHIGPNVGRVTLSNECGRRHSVLLYFDGFLSLLCGDSDTHFLCPRTVEERPVTIQQAEYDNSHELLDVS